ncbi:MAG: phospholipid carrier-dependent glycosyltransferase [Dehalococcoidia bacterium]|nr:MAG: phospholipid carrier-dependent glycosyltransferase [Dehalococcoidia bacterium]
MTDGGMAEATARSVAVPAPEAIGAARRSSRTTVTARARGRVSLAAFAGVVALSFALNAWSIDDAGLGNTYYAAAVRSMTVSWKAFFFGAFDPGGFITVDKPPVFLWVGALSARIFGYSSWSLLLPSAVAGSASVALLWLIVRRWFGVTAATIAGLALALSPISVAVNRLNLPEPFMILALVAAAGAVLRSIESRRWWAWTALAGALVGVAFNTKMLAAWIPGPAFALAIVAAPPHLDRATLRRLVARLAVLAAVTLAVSASWMLIVDAWPASQRPYVGGSTDNTVLDLALGYNGFGRVDGADQGGGPPQGRVQPGGRFGAGPGPAAPPPAARGGRFNGPGGIIAGIPGVGRMFDASNGGQIAWLLPFALIASLAALWHWRRDPMRRAAVVLFAGWILLYGGVFSYAHGIFHTYYTSAMAPGVAAMAGIGTVSLARAARRDRRWLIVAAAAIVATVWAQLVIEDRTPDFYGWMRPLMLFGVIAGAVATLALVSTRRPVTAGLALTVAGLLLLPAGWSMSAVANSALNTTLPQAGPRQGASGQTFGSEAFDDGSSRLAAWLETHGASSSTWQLVVPSAQNGARLEAENGLSVMALGGFLGRDPTITLARFAGYVAAGEVRYVLVSEGRGGGPRPAGPAPGFGPGAGAGPGFVPRNGFPGGAFPRPGPGGIVGRPSPSAAGAQAVIPAVQQACAPVDDASLPAQYRGALYDCAGRAQALSGLAR